MVDGEEIEKITTEKREFLTNLTFWRQRLRIHTFAKYIFLAGMISIMLCNVVAVGMIYFSSDGFISDMIVLVAFLFCSIMSASIPKSFQELILNNKNLFYLDETYESYISHVTEVFKSRKEFILPIIVGLLYGVSFVYVGGIGTNFQGYALKGELIIIEAGTINYLAYLMLLVIALVIFSTFVMFILSTLFLVVFTFKCINLLGTEEFPLNVNYKELKIGAFNDIGQFIISISIPLVLLCTVISILGAVALVMFNSVVMGPLYLIVGLLITILVSFLLYKNTIDIHDSLAKFKEELQESIVSHIQIILSWPAEEVDYHNIYRIQSFLKEVDDIRDWPFNPSSIKKLIITLGTPLLPLFLSIVGISL